MSSTVPLPTTRPGGRPLISWATNVTTSTGFVTSSTTSSPGNALATYWVVIHTSGRPVAASAATAQAASPLPP